MIQDQLKSNHIEMLKMILVDYFELINNLNDTRQFIENHSFRFSENFKRYRKLINFTQFPELIN